MVLYIEISTKNVRLQCIFKDKSSLFSPPFTTLVVRISVSPTALELLGEFSNPFKDFYSFTKIGPGVLIDTRLFLPFSMARLPSQQRSIGRLHSVHGAVLRMYPRNGPSQGAYSLGVTETARHCTQAPDVSW